MLKASRPLSGTAAFEKIYDIEKIISPQIYKTFAVNKLDAVLMAPFVTPAPKHGEIGVLIFLLRNCSISLPFQLLGMCCHTQRELYRLQLCEQMNKISMTNLMTFTQKM